MRFNAQVDGHNLTVFNLKNIGGLNFFFKLNCNSTLMYGVGFVYVYEGKNGKRYL